jgi:transposase-like protein
LRLSPDITKASSLAHSPGSKPIAETRRQLREDREALDQQLADRYQAGEGVKALAAELGMHHRTVKKRLEAAGVVLREQRILSDDQIERARGMYEQGMSTQHIGTEFGVSHNTIRRHLHHMGVEMRPMGRPSRTD